jgi:hypothetical protein
MENAFYWQAAFFVLVDFTEPLFPQYLHIHKVYTVEKGLWFHFSLL